ncbi:hypothetical protein RI129_003050 [Pyrocoelia pectoralis]|uniref:DDE Tnp4 domain-containing protein n=1 Tax=Pyrocoelia pectoralis TaxID=417401 RepID=A0AAN7ZUJ2_9COLE
MDYDINAYSSDEEIIRRPKIIRYRQNYFEEYDGYDFFTRFRLTKRTVENVILNEIEDIISHPTNRNDCLSASQQLLLTLNFFANGSFLRCAGDFGGVSTLTACTTVKRVSVALAGLRPRYIKMPSTDEEIFELRQNFYNIARLPRCIAAIDSELFRNRKQFFSFNVQTVSDPHLKIRNIVARWPGSAHDSHIFRNSNLCAMFERGSYPGSFMVGDSGYGVKPYLITPLANPRTPGEILFNEAQIRTRNVVERQYGVWKRRFPSLAMGLRTSLDTTQAIIVAAAVLHNIACDENEVIPPVSEDEEAAINFANNVDIQHIPDHRHNITTSTRDGLINDYFNRL